MGNTPKNMSTKSAITIAGLALATAFAAVSRTQPDQFAIQETLYRFNSEIIPPRISIQIPFIQFTHNFQANTQKIEFNAGSCRFWPLCDSTKDQNPLTANIVLNYKILPDKKKLSYHLWEMDGFVMPDGYWLLTDLLNQSTNAVMGRGDLAEHLRKPEDFLKALKEDFAFRAEQNNVPIEIESLELKKFKTSYWPINSIGYAVIKGP